MKAKLTHFYHSQYAMDKSDLILQTGSAQAV